MTRTLLEICVDSFESAVAAIRGGADRLELCAALSEGGLTPSVGLLVQIRDFIAREAPSHESPKLFVMIRCRRGSDFCYSEPEMQIMLYDMKLLAEAGADGFVFGALTDNGEIHREHCQRIAAEAQAVNKPLTFHRAFDCTNREQMSETLKVLVSLGYSTILTSGFEKTAWTGVETIARLVQLATEIEASSGALVTIMPGSGLTQFYAAEIIRKTKCAAIHASARSLKKSTRPNSLSMGGNSADSEGLLVCNETIVRQINSLIDAVAISERYRPRSNRTERSK
ncbi:copper homeostasis protein cutC homolog [Wyeomyia smithii]|uniref:copper homeostasis protein cutC homolog n=1 Tax=Wyeomyia smithii TaxID=174621 RepID=UPI002467F4F8|nr:copper homeostasis protein cutC homolog [Wyeomyia smithii]